MNILESEENLSRDAPAFRFLEGLPPLLEVVEKIAAVAILGNKIEALGSLKCISEVEDEWMITCHFQDEALV